jgi:AcrR family transcriptional regulator
VYENFERIPKAEQESILAACIEEFARQGYSKASTNAIVKRAGIPKGTLFYYFGSKKDLFLYVFDYAIERYTTEFNRMAGELPSECTSRGTHQNIVLSLADDSGTFCSTSQCSTIFPLSSKRKISILAHCSSPGHSW